MNAPTSPDIVASGHPILRAIAVAVPKEMFGTPKLKTITDKMIRALRIEPHGVAIAAPQIAESWRIFVVRGYVLAGKYRYDPDSNTIKDKVFINPVYTRVSQKKGIINDEGCLSVPNVYGDIERAVRVTIRAQDETGKKFVRSGSDLLAEIFEHEIDHLNGILFIDKATNVHEGKEKK